MNIGEFPAKYENIMVDAIIFAVLACILILGIMSYFFKPAHEASLNMVVQCLTQVFAAACGAKWGLTQSAKSQGPEKSNDRT